MALFRILRNASAAPLSASLALCLALAGCVTAPEYHPPAVEMPASYKEAAASASAGTAAIAPDWWRVYADPALDGLEQRVEVSSETVRKAMAQLQDARAQMSAARAAYFPVIGAGASATRSHTSANVVGRSLAGKTEPDYLLGVSASWEPDLWGRIGNAADAAHARAQASADDVAAVRLGVQAEVASDYFSLRSADRELGLLTRTADAYATVLELVGNRYRGGIASEGEVSQAQAQLETTRAQVADVRLVRAQLEHALATLVGVPAPSFSLPSVADAGALPALPAVPRALPSELLQRRPDIAAAERRVAAANAQIGVARAAFFPSLMLAAGFGLESTDLASLLTAPSRFWALGPALATTLFDGGRRQAQSDSARAQFDASAADYRGTVLRAFQEVEDNFAALDVLGQEAASQQAAVDAADHALALGLERYRKGAVAYLDVSVLQSAALASERSAEAVRRRQLVASVMLVKALGGGWQEDGGEAPTAAAPPTASR